MARFRSVEFWLAVFILPFVVLAVAEITGLSNLVQYTPPFTLPEFAQIVGALGSFVLTGALVYLYFQQKRVLESQVELKRAELSGELYVNQYSYEGKSVEIELSNLSGSEISELKLYTEIFPQQIDGKQLSAHGKPLQRADEHATQFGRLAGLAPREQSVTFEGTPSVYYTTEDGEERLPELTYFITELRRAGIEEVHCRMWVEGADQLGERVKSKVLQLDKKIRIDTDKSAAQEPVLEDVIGPIRGSIDESKSAF